MFSLDFISMATIAGSGIALLSGPLGSFIVWRRLSNFGDTLSHATLLGICFAWMLNMNLYIGVMIISMITALLLASLTQTGRFASDTVIGILSQTTLAFGLILATLLKNVRIDLLSYLYGDILSVSQSDLFWIYSVSISALLLLIRFWRPLLSITVHAELAFVEGVNVRLFAWLFTILMAVVFAVAIKVMGVLLIAALLIIPASSARALTRTPEQMALLASCLGILSVMIGVQFSVYVDCPTGPAIVAVASITFFSIQFILGMKAFWSRTMTSASK
jgi:zinc transport system permease protein